MTRRARDPMSGFTLVELLVVILIIGILAAIALPLFLGQEGKARDAEAKSNARNLVSQVESCFAREEDYRGCQTLAALGTTGLSLGGGTGQVTVAAPSAHVYTITALSTSGTTYVIAKDLGTGAVQSCSPSGSGGCASNGSW